MHPLVVVLLLAAGFSESLGRILPMLSARREGTARPVPRAVALGLLFTGAVAEGAVFALWAPAAWTILESARPELRSQPPASWTPELVAPLLLAAVLAFPLLGPLLHRLLLVGVGAGLALAIAESARVSWPGAAVCVAVAGAALALTVGGVRRVVTRAVRRRTAVRIAT